MGDIFFPFLPGSGVTGPHERYYEALQAAAVGRSYQNNRNNAATVSSIIHKTTAMTTGKMAANNNSKSDSEAKQQTNSRQVSSPPVPALLKKLRIANGEANSGDCWDASGYGADKDGKVGKDLENLQIRDQQAVTQQQEKQDLLFRLSLLKRVGTHDDDDEEEEPHY